MFRESGHFKALPGWFHVPGIVQTIPRKTKNGVHFLLMLHKKRRPLWHLPEGGHSFCLSSELQVR